MSISQPLIDNSSSTCVSRVTCSINPLHLTTWAQVQGVSIWMPAPHDADAAMTLLRHTLTCEALLSVESAAPCSVQRAWRDRPVPASGRRRRALRRPAAKKAGAGYGVLSLANIRQYGETPLPSSRPASGGRDERTRGPFRTRVVAPPAGRATTRSPSTRATRLRGSRSPATRPPRPLPPPGCRGQRGLGSCAPAEAA